MNCIFTIHYRLPDKKADPILMGFGFTVDWQFIVPISGGLKLGRASKLSAHGDHAETCEEMARAQWHLQAPRLGASKPGIYSGDKSTY